MHTSCAWISCTRMNLQQTRHECVPRLHHDTTMTHYMAQHAVDVHVRIIWKKTRQTNMSCIYMSSICIYDVNTTIENVRVSQCTQTYMQMNTHVSNKLGCSLMDRHTWLLDRYTCHVTVYSCVSVHQQTCGSVHVTCIFPAANDPVHCIYIVDTYILHPYVVCTYIMTICAPHSFISFAAYASTYTRTYTQMYDPYLSVCLYLYILRMQPSNLHIYHI